MEPSNDRLFVQVGAKPEAIEQLDTKAYSFWRSVFREFFHKPGAIISLIVLGIVIFFTFFGPLIRSFPTMGMSQFLPNETPNSTNWFGTNQHGQDIWTEVWYGCRMSLKIALIVSVIDFSLGIIIGAIWGYFRKIDPIMIEVRNFISNIPSMLLIVLLMVIFTRSFWTMIFALTATGWLGLASYVRNHIIVISNTEFNIASRTLGTKSFRMITHNILPYLLSIIVTVMAGMIPGVIGSEVGLSYLGFGLSFNKPTETSLGVVLENGFLSDPIDLPHILFFPALVLAMLTLSFFKMGMTLADACDPKNHR